MGYSVYFRDGRWCGYGVPATCDMPGCDEAIDRGLGYKCEDYEVVTQSGVELEYEGCGLFFCREHIWHDESHDEAEPSPDTREWLHHMLTDESWQGWRDENPERIAEIRKAAGLEPFKEPQRSKK